MGDLCSFCKLIFIDNYLGAFLMSLNGLHFISLRYFQKITLENKKGIKSLNNVTFEALIIKHQIEKFS